jgi:hypothetical protein
MQLEELLSLVKFQMDPLPVLGLNLTRLDAIRYSLSVSE